MADIADDIKNSKNHLFHYTSFDSALKILSSNSLRFGSFENMNDISESGRQVLSEVDSDLMDKILSEYRSISLTADSWPVRGFAIDCLWGYYAEKGNGVCLVFDKTKLIEQYKAFRSKGVGRNLYIKYVTDFSNLNFAEGRSETEVREYIINNIREIFYIKDICWKHEREVRFLTQSTCDVYLPLGGSLLGVILCCTRISCTQDSYRYKCINALCRDYGIPILLYENNLGTKELFQGERKVWPFNTILLE